MGCFIFGALLGDMMRCRVKLSVLFYYSTPLKIAFKQKDFAKCQYQQWGRPRDKHRHGTAVQWPNIHTRALTVKPLQIHCLCSFTQSVTAGLLFTPLTVESCGFPITTITTILWLSKCPLLQTQDIISCVGVGWQFRDTGVFFNPKNWTIAHVYINPLVHKSQDFHVLFHVLTSSWKKIAYHCHQYSPKETIDPYFHLNLPLINIFIMCRLPSE